MRRIALVLVPAAAGALGTAGQAAAVTWTPVDTGVADDISAVDHRGDGQVWIATAAGRIAHKPNGAAFEAPDFFPGRRFTDIAFRGTGDVGLATADAGHLFRFAGGAWAPVDLANTTFNHTCPGSGTFARDSAPTADLLAVEWSGENVAWVVSAARGQILKSVDAGATWQDVGRQADGTCRINRDLTDVAPLDGSANDVYFVDNGGGTIWRTTDGLMTNGQQRGDLIGCSNVLARVAADLDSPNRVSVAAPCGGVVARCVDRRGRRCGGKLRKAFTKRHARGTVRIKRPLIRRPIKAGNRIEVVVSNPGYVTQIKIIKIRRGKAPTISTRCRRPGASKRTRC